MSRTPESLACHFTALYPLSCGQGRHLTKQGTPKVVTEARCNLAIQSLKFGAQIPKFQGDIPKTSKHGISLVRLAKCTDQATLVAAERIDCLVERNASLRWGY
jgi:hypothetical protein